MFPGGVRRVCGSYSYCHDSISGWDRSDRGRSDSSERAGGIADLSLQRLHIDALPHTGNDVLGVSGQRLERAVREHPLEPHRTRYGTTSLYPHPW